MDISSSLFWSDLDPNRIWRPPTPRPQPPGGTPHAVMMRPNYCAPCSSSHFVMAAPPNPNLEEQILAGFRNVSLRHGKQFQQQSLGPAGLGVGKMNIWQMPSSLSLSNGFTSDSSAPLSPNSSEEPPRTPTTGMYHQFASRPPPSNASLSTQRSNQTQRFLGGAAPKPAAPSYGQVAPVRPVTEHYHPGMRDLTYWLKKLRLHKYTPLFEKMTYKEMLSINNDVLERLKVTTGARKKIMQSIEKLRERPQVLREMEMAIRRGEQCIRCAICTIRQMLWSPFMKYEYGVNMKKRQQFIDGLNLPLSMISDENIPALIVRVVELLNQLIFPTTKLTEDLEDEYLLTMFQIFDSIIKNEQFTPLHQKNALMMKKSARNYASPEEMRKHRMGMVSSSQCEDCHHKEVVNRERQLEQQEREARKARGEHVTELAWPKKDLTLIRNGLFPPIATQQPVASPPSRQQQKRPASDENLPQMASSSPKIASNSFVDDSASLYKNILNSKYIWAEEETENVASTSLTEHVLHYPEYRNPHHDENETTRPVFGLATDIQQPAENVDRYPNVMDQSTFDFLEILNQMNDRPSRTYSFSELNSSSTDSSPNLKKASSTGSYSSSDSGSSSAGVVSPRSSRADVVQNEVTGPFSNLDYGLNTVLFPQLL